MKLYATYFRGEIKDNVTDVVPSFDLLIPKNKDLAPAEDVSKSFLWIVALNQYSITNCITSQNYNWKMMYF